MQLTPDDIFGTSDLKIETCDVPEWGGAVCLREMSGTDREAWEREAFGDKGDRPVTNTHRATLLAYCLCDSTGARLFVNSQIGKLSAKSSKVLIRLYAQAAAINGLSKEAKEKAAKNS